MTEIGRCSKENRMVTLPAEHVTETMKEPNTEEHQVQTER